MSHSHPHLTARPDGSCEDCGSFRGSRTPTATEVANQRWQYCVTPQIELLARRDPHLHALLRVWRLDAERSFEWVAREYLKRWDDLAPLVGQMGMNGELWQSIWPKWPDDLGNFHRADVEATEIAKGVLIDAATVARMIMGHYSTWLDLQPPPPLRVTLAEAARMGFLPSPPAAGG